MIVYIDSYEVHSESAGFGPRLITQAMKHKREIKFGSLMTMFQSKVHDMKFIMYLVA